MNEARGTSAGIDLANALIEFIHLMYQKSTARRVLYDLINQLRERSKEFNDDRVKPCL